MIDRKKFTLAACVMAISVLTIGCQNAEDNKQKVKTEETTPKETSVESANEGSTEEKQEVKTEAVKLSDWSGTWNNMGAYLEDKELQGAYKGLAEKEKMTEEEAKEMYLKKRKVDFDGLVIDGNKVTFLDGFKDKDGKEISSMEYEYKETKVVKSGDRDLTWFVFESSEDGEYKTLLMMPVDTEEALMHFHMRYGKDADELANMEGWFPTFVSPDSTNEQLFEEIAE